MITLDTRDAQALARHARGGDAAEVLAELAGIVGRDSSPAAALLSAELRRLVSTLDDYLAAPFLAEPLRLLDSCLISDGGAAYVTTSLERARDLKQPPAVVLGVGEGYSGAGAHWSQQQVFTSTPQPVFCSKVLMSA